MKALLKIARLYAELIAGLIEDLAFEYHFRKYRDRKVLLRKVLSTKAALEDFAGKSDRHQEDYYVIFTMKYLDSIIEAIGANEKLPACNALGLAIMKGGSLIDNDQSLLGSICVITGAVEKFHS